LQRSFLKLIYGRIAAFFRPTAQIYPSPLDEFWSL
jgi:hypothetical protein